MERMFGEVCSPPRVAVAVEMLPSLYLISGLALDLATKDEDGNPLYFPTGTVMTKVDACFARRNLYSSSGVPCAATICHSRDPTMRNWDEQKQT